MKKYKWIWVWACLSIAFAVVIHFAFKISAPYKSMEAVWSAGDILTYVSTISLGLFAMWQNQKMAYDSEKRERKTLAIEKYVLFDFSDLETKFYCGDNINNGVDGMPIETGFNGNKAIWKYSSLQGMEKLRIRLVVRNIGDFPATNIRVIDKRGKKIENTNVIHGLDDNNDKKYILNGEKGILIIIVQLEELTEKKELKYKFAFQNPFGSAYAQSIVVKSTYQNKIIQIDTQGYLETMEE